MSVRRKACCSTGAPIYRRPENTDTEVFSQEVIQDTDLTHYKLLYLKTCGHWFDANKICEYYATKAQECVEEEDKRNIHPTYENPVYDMNCPVCREKFYPSDLDWVDPPIPATAEGLQELFEEKEIAQKNLKRWQRDTMWWQPFDKLYAAMKVFLEINARDTFDIDNYKGIGLNMENGAVLNFIDSPMEILVLDATTYPEKAHSVKECVWSTRQVARFSRSSRLGGYIIVNQEAEMPVWYFLMSAMTCSADKNFLEGLKNPDRFPPDNPLRIEIEDWLYGYFGEDENPELGLPGSTQQAAAY